MKKKDVMMGKTLNKTYCCLQERSLYALSSLQVKTHNLLSNSRGQGTTEYAILVGVLVVIAILAITIFRPKIQELWDAIASGINSL